MLIVKPSSFAKKLLFGHGFLLVTNLEHRTSNVLKITNVNYIISVGLQLVVRLRQITLSACPYIVKMSTPNLAGIVLIGKPQL